MVQLPLLESKYYRTLALWLKYARGNALSKTKLQLPSGDLNHDYRITSVLIKHLHLVGELDAYAATGRLDTQNADTGRLDTQTLIFSSFILNKRNATDPYHLLLSYSMETLLTMNPLGSSASMDQDQQMLQILRSLAYLIFDIPFDATIVDMQNDRHDFDFFDLRDCELLFNFWLTFTPHTLPQRVVVV